MIRWTIALCALIYVGMIVVPEAVPVQPQTTPEVATQAAFDPAANLPTADASEGVQIASTQPLEEGILAPATAEPAPAMVVLGPDGEVIEVTAVIRPVDTANEMVRLARQVEPENAEAIAPPIRETVFVTGSRVNMRAGPSTANPVVVALGFGAEAELIEEVAGGWTQIRDIESGRVGYMAARFLSPTRP